MPNFYNRQQQERNSLILGLLLSLLVHGAIALIVSRYQTKEFVSAEEKSLTPIAIVELTELRNTETSSDKSSSNTLAKSAQNSQKVAAPETLTDPTVEEKLSPSKPPTPPETTPPKSPPNPTLKPPPIPPAVTETPEIKPVITKPNKDRVTADNTQVASTPTTKPEKKVNPPTIQPEKPIEDNQPPDKPFENSSLAEKKPLANLDKPVPNREQPSSKLPTTERSRFNQKPNPGDFEGTVANNSDAKSKTDDNGDDLNNDRAAANNDLNQPLAPLSIACKDNCQPEYPDVLDGVEGTAGIQLTLDRKGKVIDAAIAISSGNSLLDESALEAAKQMEFSEIDRDRAIVQINLSFDVADEEW
ncbi:TonB family protein [Waterburya agarophytonicola K14]|uniref:TonB family protein n=1 Tax=Waterburya agarophytonicola KI4 TaxID=2874699 RepID=A0A964BTT6_9CYAN|nr:energy transducer TonB [Waterburya agarophytonicola]MCC0179553.1 TonB family protein [Waterburya agarophytonicola KI4]